MPSLYTLTDNALRLVGALEGADDAEYAQLVAEYEANAVDIADKLDGYARIIRTLESDALAIHAEEQRLAGIRERLENNIKRMREAVRAAMDVVGAEKVKTTIGTWSIRNNAASVNVLDEALIPDEYKVPQPAKLDKRLLLSELKEGVLVDGAELMRGTSLQFR